MRPLERPKPGNLFLRDENINEIPVKYTPACLPVSLEVLMKELLEKLPFIKKKKQGPFAAQIKKAKKQVHRLFKSQRF